MREQLRVLSVYQEFFLGGARVLHTDLIAGLHAAGYQHHSVVGSYREVYREHTTHRMEDDHCYRRLIDAGIGVASLGRRRTEKSGHLPYGAAEIAQFTHHAEQAHIVLSLKEQPLDLINAACLANPVVACLHRSDPENQGAALGELTKAVEAGRVTMCILPAESAKRAYVAAGLPAERLRVIPNGVDLSRFTPSPRRRAEMRRKLQITDDAPVVIFAARYDGMKNVPLFLESARIYLEMQSDAHVILCGAGMTPENERLQKTVQKIFGDKTYLTANMRFLGMRSDMETMYATADIVSLTSAFGEAYPLCLVEGMACGTVPVSTDVGDTRLIVGGRGLITSDCPRDVARSWQQAYAHRMDFQLSDEERNSFGREYMIAAYADLISEAVRPVPAQVGVGVQATVEAIPMCAG